MFLFLIVKNNTFMDIENSIKNEIKKNKSKLKVIERYPMKSNRIYLENFAVSIFPKVMDDKISKTVEEKPNHLSNNRNSFNFEFCKTNNNLNFKKKAYAIQKITTPNKNSRNERELNRSKINHMKFYNTSSSIFVAPTINVLNLNLDFYNNSRNVKCLKTRSQDIGADSFLKKNSYACWMKRQINCCNYNKYTSINHRKRKSPLKRKSKYHQKKFFSSKKHNLNYTNHAPRIDSFPNKFRTSILNIQLKNNIHSFS